MLLWPKHLSRCISADGTLEIPYSNIDQQPPAKSTPSLMLLLAASQGCVWLACTCTKESKNYLASASIVAAARSARPRPRCARHAGHEAATGSGVGLGEATHGPRGARLCHRHGVMAGLEDCVSIRYVHVQVRVVEGKVTYAAAVGDEGGECMVAYAAEAVDGDGLFAGVDGVRAGAGW